MPSITLTNGGVVVVIEYTTTSTYALYAYHLCVRIPLMSRCFRYNIMLMKFVSDLLQVGGFSPSTPISSTNNTDRHEITMKYCWQWR